MKTISQIPESSEIETDLELDIGFAVNPENRCPVILLLDTSSSMAGAAIEQLNAGLVTFKTEVEQDERASISVEVAIVTFDSQVELIQEFVTISNFSPPVLKAKGQTHLGEGIQLALHQLELRKTQYKNNGIGYYRPWIFLITDGQPNDNYQLAIEQVRQEEALNRLSWFTVGVGDQIAPETLKMLAGPRQPIQLKGLNFRELFVWLSCSVRSVSTGKIGEVMALPPADWGQIVT